MQKLFVNNFVIEWALKQSLHVDALLEYNSARWFGLYKKAQIRRRRPWGSVLYDGKKDKNSLYKSFRLCQAAVNLRWLSYSSVQEDYFFCNRFIMCVIFHVWTRWLFHINHYHYIGTWSSWLHFFQSSRDVSLTFISFVMRVVVFLQVKPAHLRTIYGRKTHSWLLISARPTKAHYHKWWSRLLRLSFPKLLSVKTAKLILFWNPPFPSRQNEVSPFSHQY